MNIFDLEPSAPTSAFSTLAWGFRAARVLQVAVRLRLFTHLADRPTDSTMLARRLKSDPSMTERLLVALAALDLVRHDDEMWRNTLAASLYLVEGKPMYQGEVIEWAAREWEKYQHLERLIREGRRDDTFTFGQDDESRAAYLRAMHALGAAGAAQRLARMIPIAGRRTLLDVGGAPGTWSIALAQRHAALKITLLTEEENVEESRHALSAFDVAKRVRVKAAQWRARSFGKNEYEALLLSRLAPSTDGTTLALLVRAYEALKQHGLLIVHAYLLDNDLNGGGEAAFRQLTEESCTIEQCIAMLEEAGFERIALLHRDPVQGDLLIGYKGAESLAEPPESLVEVVTPELSLVGASGSEFDEDVLLATHRRAWSGVIERLN